MDLPTFLIEALKVNGAVLSAWAWPVAFIACAVLFKREVRALIQRVKSLKGAGVEAAFEEGLEVLEEAPNSNVTESAEQAATAASEHRTQKDERPSPPVGGEPKKSDAAPHVPASVNDVPLPHQVMHPDSSLDEESGVRGIHWKAIQAIRHLSEGRTTVKNLVGRDWHRVQSALRELYLTNNNRNTRASTAAMLERLAQQGIVDSELAFKIEELQALRNIAMVDEGELSAENYERYAMQANRVWRELVNARRNLLPLEK